MNLSFRKWVPGGFCYVCCCLVTKSFPTLLWPCDSSPPGSSVHGISQTRAIWRPSWMSQPPCLDPVAVLFQGALSFSNFLGVLPWWLRWWRIYLQCRKPWFDPWVGKIFWRRKWQPIQRVNILVSLGILSLAGQFLIYSESMNILVVYICLFELGYCESRHEVFLPIRSGCWTCPRWMAISGSGP